MPSCSVSQCATIAVADSCDSDVVYLFSGNFSIPYQYIVSLYWATATTTTVGYGDIRAHTDLERSYATFVMIIGVVAYGYIIASVAATLANADSGRAQYQDKLKAVKSYLKVSEKHNQMPHKLKQSLQYFTYHTQLTCRIKVWTQR